MKIKKWRDIKRMYYNITARHGDAISLVINQSTYFINFAITLHFVFNSGGFHEKGILSFALDNSFDTWNVSRQKVNTFEKQNPRRKIGNWGRVPFCQYLLTSLFFRIILRPFSKREDFIFYVFVFDFGIAHLRRYFW